MSDQFKIQDTGDWVDLDNMDIYSDEDKEKGWATLRTDCWHELGYAILYMDYIHNYPAWPENQRRRVEELIYELKATRNFPNVDNQLYWLKFKFRIACEIENMC